MIKYIYFSPQDIILLTRKILEALPLKSGINRAKKTTIYITIQHYARKLVNKRNKFKE